MPAPLPDPPRVDHWPPAVRSAELARGSILRCGPGLRPAGWPEHPRVRVAALAPWLGEGRTAIEMTAAWVWAACEWSDAFLSLGLASDRRVGVLRLPRGSLRRLTFEDGDVIRFRGLAVTAPLRTAFDILHRRGPLDADASTACRRLLTPLPDGRERLLEMCERRGYPGRRRAACRIERGIVAEAGCDEAAGDEAAGDEAAGDEAETSELEAESRSGPPQPSLTR